jgi:hypothetical protein
LPTPVVSGVADDGYSNRDEVEPYCVHMKIIHKINYFSPFYILWFPPKKLNELKPIKHKKSSGLKLCDHLNEIKFL